MDAHRYAPPHPSQAPPVPLMPPAWPVPPGWKPPPSDTPPPPPPRGARAAIRPQRRRWPLLAFALAGLFAAALGVSGGAAAATASAAATATRLSARGDYATAIALDTAVGSRTGPLYILDRSDPGAAAGNADSAMLAWAASLGRQGRVDEAMALYRSIAKPSLRDRVRRALADMLLAAAAADVARGDAASAVSRLEELLGNDPPAAQAARAGAELPADQVAEARALVLAGHGADAVALLDQLAVGASAAAVSAAGAVYPAALLAAGREELGAQSYRESLGTLTRLVGSYADTPEATQARAMLSAAQSVSGTMVGSRGHALSGPVRISSHYVAEPGGSYLTSGPFYTGTADAGGDFTIEGIPVGGPYVLEVFTSGSWTTLIDPRTGQPADPVSVIPLQPVALTIIVLPT